MKRIDVAVVDCGMGNLRSLCKALEYVAPMLSVMITNNADDIMRAHRVVFPGQGAMRDCMRELDARGLREPLLIATQDKPFLGICIGLQILFEHSQESGGTQGLGLFKGEVQRFNLAQRHDNLGNAFKIPHIGWNKVWQTSHCLWRDITDGERFYYVHSYYVCPQNTACIAGTTHYAIPFTAAIAKDNIFAVQFHPEKSAKSGLQLLNNFVHWFP